jgi:PAS domain-containing protein
MTWPLSSAWHAVQEDGSPFPPEGFPVAVALRTGEIVPDTVVGVPHGRTGEPRWLGITVVPDARDEDGPSQRAYAMFQDLTKQRRTEATLREGAELMSRLRDANVLGVVVNGGDRVYQANDAFLEMIGYSRDDLAAGASPGPVSRLRNGWSVTWRHASNCSVPGPSGRMKRSTCTGTG